VLHGGSKLLQPMVAALQDDNRDVRCAAAWGLGTWRFPQALVALEAIVESKEIRDATSNEMRAMFSAYARVGQQKSLATLGSILNKKSLFGKREPTEMRVCAARALGALKSQEAEKQLQQAANDKDTSVRRAVTRSLLAGGK
jgi:HEAT repeat protein